MIMVSSPLPFVISVAGDEITKYISTGHVHSGILGKQISFSNSLMELESSCPTFPEVPSPSTAKQDPLSPWAMGRSSVDPRCPLWCSVPVISLPFSQGPLFSAAPARHTQGLLAADLVAAAPWTLCLKAATHWDVDPRA